MDQRCENSAITYKYLLISRPPKMKMTPANIHQPEGFLSTPVMINTNPDRAATVPPWLPVFVGILQIFLLCNRRGDKKVFILQADVEWQQ